MRYGRSSEDVVGEVEYSPGLLEEEADLERGIAWRAPTCAAGLVYFAEGRHISSLTAG